jgi:hypothetical protein
MNRFSKDIDTTDNILSGSDPSGTVGIVNSD